MRGRLDPSIDAASLFEVDLTGALLGAEPAAALSGLLEQVGARRRPAATPAAGDALAAARGAAQAALVDFLRRPAAERERLLRRHEERRRQAEASRRAAEAERDLLAATELKASRLAALLDGTLEPDVDPAPLLRLDLAEPVELATDAARRRRFLAGVGGKAEPAPAGAADPGAPVGARLAAARLRLDGLRLRWLALGPDQRAALLERHRRGAADEAALRAAAVRRAEAARQAEAERQAAASRQAEEERRRAEEAVRRAETEGARLAAEERVRLLAAKEALAGAEAELRKQREVAEAAREQALGWIRRVRELEARSVLDGDREADADRAYERLVGDLTAVRADLRAALDDLTSDRSRVPAAPPPADFQLPDPALDALRAELAATGERLRLLEDGLRWERVAMERDAMESMNQVRLRLLELATPAKRAALRGFGPTGVRQGLRELNQIALELRYHRYWLPRVAGARLQAARSAPLPELVGLVELAALVLLFRWWRRRADRVLLELQRHFRGRRPAGPLDRAGWSLAWYLRRVRAPLEWLVLTLVLARFRTAAEVPEVGYLLLVVAWALAGWLVMRLLDAVAARQGESGEGTAALRWRSLRLSGATVVGLGLLLSVAERSVGRGALYGWITTAAWLVVLPILVVLVAWWRPVIFSRIRTREARGALLEGVLARAEGLAAYPAAAVGGVWLLAEGVGAFLSRQLRGLTAARRVLAWLFRRELERQAAARVHRVEAEPLPEAPRQALRPEAPGAERVEAFARKELARVLELAGQKGSLIAVVGERGLGKTSLLDRVLADPAAAGALRVTTRPGTFDDLVADLAAASGLEPGASAARLAEHLRELRPPLVCVDDLQRIVRPVIGGLADVDRLLGLARAVGPATSWVAAVGTPGYGYLERAREGRVTFDEVVRLPPWTVDEISALVRARTRQAGLAPSFEELMVSRPGEMVSGESRRDRTERDYYGLLWDQAGGNPAVALHLWGESLGLRPGTDEVLVRLPDAPGPDDLEDQPLAFFFVLRAVLQLELASERDVARCTDLRQADVADALRVARTRGLVEPAGDRLRVSLHWYRAATQSLRRRHLVAF